ncbi:hypothetical protein IEO21_08768 [Rhodonia placenta]|uniref:Secreted protein n=1 Tax=Rhodonia placenta TaxID=104341 RepID=A0A8H7NVP8_9APHY|nr:hypothetical protein IEO21_08768 [Postia placenta]
MQRRVGFLDLAEVLCLFATVPEYLCTRGAPFVNRPFTDGVWNHSSLDCVQRGSTCLTTR